MLMKYDWYIVPVLNPDGYEYTVNFDKTLKIIIIIIIIKCKH